MSTKTWSKEGHEPACSECHQPREEGFQPFPATIAGSLASLDGVRSVDAVALEPVVDLSGRVPLEQAVNDPSGKYYTTLGGMRPASLEQAFPQQVTSGRMFSAPGEMIVEAKEAEREGYRLGQRLEWYSPVSQRTLRVTVVGIFDTGDGQAIAEKWVSRETLTKAGLARQDNFVAIHLAPGADRAVTEAALEQKVADLPMVTVMDANEYADTVLSQVRKSISLLDAMLAPSIIIAVLGIVNTLGLSIVERTRELWLLRAVALTQAQVRRMITLESVVISLLGAVVGVGLVLVYGIVLQRLMGDMGITLLRIPWAQLGAFLVAAVLVGVLAAWWPAVRASRANVLAAIASE